MWIDRREGLEASTNELFNAMALRKERANVNQLLRSRTPLTPTRPWKGGPPPGSTVLTIEPTVHRSYP